MTLRVYKLNEDSICVSSEHNRVVISERMLDNDNDASLDILPGPAGDHMELLASIIPALEVGDIVKGLDIIHPRRGMIVEQFPTGRIYCYMDDHDIIEDGFKAESAWYSPGSSWKRNELPNVEYKVLKTGE